MKKYLIIGNGIAGTTAADEIRKHDNNGQIILITNESLPLYSRIRLPDYICGRINENELIIKNQEWHDKHNIKLITGVEIERIDFLEKKVFPKNIALKQYPDKEDKTQLNSLFDFDSLLLSVGSRAFIPDIKGNGNISVMSLRTVDDAKTIMNRMRKLNNTIKETVVIGGGLLGIEAAAALNCAGIRVTVIEYFNRLLPRQLDYKGALLLQKLLENMGIIFKLDEVTEEIIGTVSESAQKLASVIKGVKVKPNVQSVRLKSGDIIRAEAVLLSAGVRPNLALAANSQIEIGKAIIVNEKMETSIQSIYAAGDVAEYQGINLCIWSEAMEQGKIAGINMAGGNAVYKNITPSNVLKVAGIAVASAGEIDVDGKMDSEIVSTESVYRKIVKDNKGKIVGCIMVGDTTDFNKIVKQIKGD